MEKTETSHNAEQRPAGHKPPAPRAPAPGNKTPVPPSVLRALGNRGVMRSLRSGQLRKGAAGVAQLRPQNSNAVQSTALRYPPAAAGYAGQPEAQFAPTTAPGWMILRDPPPQPVVPEEAIPDFSQFAASQEQIDGLPNDQLKSESLYLRKQLSALKPGDPAYATIRQNLHLVESTAIRKSVPLPAPEKGSGPTEFQGKTLTADPVWLRYLLEQIITAKGQGEAESFVSAFENQVNQGGVGAGSHAPTIEDYRLPILSGLKAQMEILKQEDAKFLEDFEQTAKETMQDLLNQSKQRIETTRVRYGIPTEEEGFAYMGNWGQESYPSLEQMGALPPPALSELSIAANLLIKGRAQRNARIAELEKQRSPYVDPATKINRYGPGFGGDEDAFRIFGEIDKIDRQIEMENRLFEAQKQELASRYPVLASFADEDKAWMLERVAKGAPFEVMGMIQGEVYEKLHNIDDAQSSLNDNDVNIWKYPHLIGATRMRMHIAEGTLRDRILQDKVKDVSDESFWKSVGLGILQLGLVLLAPFTEGATLIPAAAISGGMLVSHAEEYLQQKALAGTDFDKARAISAEDPSFFWLALDAVFFIADVNAAANAVKALKPLVTEMRTAESIEKAEEAAQALEKAAAEKGGDEFARRVVTQARQGENLSRAEQLFGKEAHTLEEAGRLAERQAGEAGLLATAVSETGDTIKLTKNGQLIVCSTPCRWLRDRYASLMAKDASFEGRVAAVENKAMMAKNAAETNLAEAERLGKEAAAETAELQRDLAYAEYRAAGGTEELGKFTAVERARLTEFRDQAVLAQKRVADAQESLRRAQEAANKAKAHLSSARKDLAYYESELEKTSKELEAKQAEVELHNSEAAARRLDPSLGDPAEAEQLAAQARGEVEKLAEELEGAQKVVSEAKSEVARAGRAAQQAEQGVKATGDQATFVAESQKRQTDLAKRIDELQWRYKELPEVRNNPYLNPPSGSEAGKLKWEIESLRNELRTEVEAAGQNIYERLRGISPGKGATERALENLKAAHPKLRSASGAPIDVTNPHLEINPSEVSPDHVYPLKRITEEEGFNRLTPTQQQEIAEMRENYLPLTRTANSSKGELTMEEWFRTPEGSKVPSDIRKILIDVETQARERVKQRIKELLAQ